MKGRRRGVSQLPTLAVLFVLLFLISSITEAATKESGPYLFVVERVQPDPLPGLHDNLRKIVAYKVYSDDRPMREVRSIVTPAPVYHLVVDAAQRFVIADLGSELLFYEFTGDEGSFIHRNTLKVSDPWRNALAAPRRIVMHPNGRFAFFVSGGIHGGTVGRPLMVAPPGSEAARSSQKMIPTEAVNIGAIELVPGEGGKMLDSQPTEGYGTLTLDPNGEHLFLTTYRSKTRDVFVSTYKIDGKTGRTKQVSSSVTCIESCDNSAPIPSNDPPLSFEIAWMSFGPSGRTFYIFFKSHSGARILGDRIVTGGFDPSSGRIVWRGTQRVEGWIADIVPDRKNDLLYVVMPVIREIRVFRENPETGSLIPEIGVAWKKPWWTRFAEFSGEPGVVTERDTKDGKALILLSRLVAVAQAPELKISLPFRCKESRSGWCLRDRFDPNIAVTLLGESSDEVCLATTGTRAPPELVPERMFTPIDILDKCGTRGNYFLALFNLSVKTYELARSREVDQEQEVRCLDTKVRKSGVFERALNKHSQRLEILHGVWSVPKKMPQVRTFAFSNHEYKLATWKNSYCDQPSVLIRDDDVSFLTTLFGRNYQGRLSTIAIISINGQAYVLVVGPLCGTDLEDRTAAVVYRLDSQDAVPIYINTDWKFGLWGGES